MAGTLEDNRIYELLLRARNQRDLEAKVELLKQRDNFSTILTRNTLKAIYKYLFILLTKLTDTNPILRASVNAEIVNFQQSPGLKSLQQLLSSISEFCRKKSPQAFFAVNDKIALILQKTISELGNILHEKFPGYRTEKCAAAQELLRGYNSILGKNDFASLASFIKILSSNGPKIEFSDLFEELTINCLSANVEDITQSFFDEKEYVYEKLTTVELKGRDYAQNQGYYVSITQKPYSVLESSIFTIPATAEKTKEAQQRLQYPFQHKFWTDDEDIYNHSIFIELSSQISQSIGFLKGIIASTVVGFGRENIEIEIEDTKNSGLAWELESIFPKGRVTINKNEQDVTESLETLDKCINYRIDHWGNFMAVARREGHFPGNLIIAVMINPHSFNYQNTEIYKRILEKGYRAGVLVISLGTVQELYDPMPKNNRMIVIKNSDHWAFNNPYDGVRLTDVDASDQNWFLSWVKGGQKLKGKWRDNFILAKLDKAEDAPHIDLNKKYIEMKDGILETPIGEAEDDEFIFRLDTEQHVHGFIIGQTGSGKSVLIHDIILGLIQRYSPIDLQLCIMDFKKGGVELNRYRELKHIRSLVVDDSDIQIVWEVVKDLESEMNKRGELFRDAGVENLKEYNNTNNPSSPCSQLVIIMDECQFLFKRDSDYKDYKRQQQIISLLTRIAKEGRSQGIHLILATQTLSDSEIPSGILNLITDRYLMNCQEQDILKIITDQNRLSTSHLNKGEVIYSHKFGGSKTIFFKDYFYPRDQKDKIIDTSIIKNNDHRSHGQFYFKGRQEFLIEPSLIYDDTTNIQPTLVAGKSIDLKQSNIDIFLPDEDGENILVYGSNEYNNPLRMSLDLIISRVLLDKYTENKTRIIVLDCFRDESDAKDVLRFLRINNNIEHYEGDKKEIITEIADSILNKTVKEPTLFCVLGQEKFKELKNNQKLIEEEVTIGESSEVSFDPCNGIIDSGGKISENTLDTVRKALEVILELGPHLGVHTLLQLDKISRFLYLDYPSKDDIVTKIKHFIILKSSEEDAAKLGLDDDIHPENLSEEKGKLRAIYFNEDNDKYKLFTPFQLPAVERLKQFLDNEN